MKCRFCGLEHSDWLSCDQAKSLGEFKVVEEPKPEKLAVEKPKFDRSKAMKEWHARRKKA